MSEVVDDWDPTSVEVLRDQESAYDTLRERCPVAHSARLGWSIFRHEDVSRVLADPETFSNVVSSRRAVPSGMDPPEHTLYRQALEPFFAEERLRKFEPTCRKIARELIQPLIQEEEIDFAHSFALPYAVRTLCAFLGWSETLTNSLGEWTRMNREAVLADDRQALVTNARLFETYMEQVVEKRRDRSLRSRGEDITTEIIDTLVNGLPLSQQELTSIFRNWTVGEVGSMTSAIGTLGRELAHSPELQGTARQDLTVLPQLIEEALRKDGPLVLNRRRVTRDVTLGGRDIVAGERIALMWISANRDERVFERPEELRLDRDQSKNLVWGAGVHVCPGAPLARLEMRIALEELLTSTTMEVGRSAAIRAVYPENGWACLPLRLRGLS